MQNVDPLPWWEEHHSKFEDVWKLAKLYLAIPATSATSERAFSSAGNVVTLRRCRLEGNLVDYTGLLRENKSIIKESM